MQSEGPNQIYHAKIVGFDTHVNQPYGLLSKIYWVDFLERDSEKYTWEGSGLSQEEIFKKAKNITLDINNPFVPNLLVGFPHEFAFFSMGNPRNPNERETNFYIRKRMNPRTLETREPSNSMGCSIEYEKIIPAEAQLFRNPNLSVENWLKSQAVPMGYKHIIDDSNKLYSFIQKSIEKFS